MTVREAAAALGVSERTIQLRIEQQSMKAERFGARSWMIAEREVERWRRMGKLKPGRKPKAPQPRKRATQPREGEQP